MTLSDKIIECCTLYSSGSTIDQICTIVSISKPTVKKYITLKSLPHGIIKQLDNKSLTLRSAMILTKMPEGTDLELLLSETDKYRVGPNHKFCDHKLRDEILEYYIEDYKQYRDCYSSGVPDVLECIKSYFDLNYGDDDMESEGYSYSGNGQYDYCGDYGQSDAIFDDADNAYSYDPVTYVIDRNDSD